MRGELDVIAITVLAVKKKRLTIEDENIKPGFDKAIEEMEVFFNQCYLRMKRHCDDDGLACILGEAAKQLRSSMNNK
jgi:hypothetical protein